MQNKINQKFDHISSNFIEIKKLTPKISIIIDICTNAIKNGNKIMICGNGGSAADAQHFAAELVGRYKMNRKAIPAIALTTDTSTITAIANDFDYNLIFERQVQAIGKNGDILIGISTSGNSKNVINAFLVAKKMGITTIAISGKDGGKMQKIADFIIDVPSTVTNSIQEMHIAIEHIICEYIEKEVANE